MALSKADKQRWDEIDELIFGAKDELKAAPDHTTLRQWAEDNGMDNGPDFGKFKSSLRKNRRGLQQPQRRNDQGT